MLKPFSFLLGVIVISLSLSYLVLAWTEPTVAPPAGNVSAPLNISATSQTKSGALSVTTLYDANNSSYFIDPSASTSAILAGNVGIGTAGPVGGWAKLSIAHDSTGGNSAEDTSALKIQSPTDATSMIMGTDPVNDYAYIQAYQDQVSWGNRPLVLQMNVGNVGIGTTSPGQKLTVAGTIESTSGGIKFPDGTTQASAGVQYDAQGRIPSGKLGFTQKVYANNAGSSIFHANDATGVSGVGLQKTKETKLNKVPDNTLKIYFECYFDFDAGNWAGYAQIYRNGGAVGTVRGCAYSWPGFTETISGWNHGDLLQIYTWMSGGGGNYRSVQARNLRILGTLEEELIQSVQ